MRRRFFQALVVYILVHAYLWWRLVGPLPAPWWHVGTALVAVLAPVFPLNMRFARRLPRARARPWLLAGYVWFGFAVYLLLAAIAAHVAVAFGAPPLASALACGAIAIAVVLGGFANVALGPRVRRVRIPLAKVGAKPYSIAHLTDVHVGALIGRDFVERLVRRVNALEPDVVVITGDLVDGRLGELRDHVEPLRELRARDGVYCITGNHESYWSPRPWLEYLGSLGIRVLRNEHVTLGGGVELAGSDDITMNEDVPRAVAGCDPSLPLVLLAHRPRTIERAMKAGVDVQLSGHTHGGQMLPWGWLARIWDPKVSGLARFGSTWLYVSDGTGYWGPPLRVGTRCEIAAITLVAY